MRSIVTFILLALLGAIAAFLLSNTAPIALTFLGMQTPALSLAIWIGAALLAGVATGLWFLVLFRLAERRGARREREQRRAEFGPDDFAVVNDGRDAQDYAGVNGYSGYASEYSSDYSYQDGDYGRDDGYHRYDDRTPDSEPAAASANDTDYRDADIAPRQNEDWRSEPFDAPLDRGDRREPELEPVEASAPVYDANYRVIQPPAEEDWRMGDRDERNPPDPSVSERISDPSYASERPYPADARGYGSADEPARQKMPQPKDDWDIESDLDW